MFELYDIFDNNEINVILLIILLLFLVFIIGGLGYYDYKLRNRLEKIQGDVDDMSILINSNNNNDSKIQKKEEKTEDEQNSNDDKINYKKKYEELVKSKDVMDSTSMQYSPSEYATLLKYNPILPYSAFTMDIINNAYLDMNERGGMFEDKYFALSNYDNIYDRSDNNNNNMMDDSEKADEDITLGAMAKLANSDNPTIQSGNNNSNNNSLSGKTNTNF